MGITRLNHAVLFVRDIERSVAFYSEVLGFKRIDMTPGGFPSTSTRRSHATAPTRAVGSGSPSRSADGGVRRG
jgi:catechol 2,3-dioxygenase-like lactoylglutathione lyase family enzyme